VLRVRLEKLIFGVIHKKVGPVLSPWRVKQSAERYLKLNTKRWTLARPFRIKFEDESRYISPFPFSILFYSGSILLVENFLLQGISTPMTRGIKPPASLNLILSIRIPLLI
jgi:hypothetical protein